MFMCRWLPAAATSLLLVAAVAAPAAAAPSLDSPASRVTSAGGLQVDLFAPAAQARPDGTRYTWTMTVTNTAATVARDVYAAARPTALFERVAGDPLPGSASLLAGPGRLAADLTWRALVLAPGGSATVVYTVTEPHQVAAVRAVATKNPLRGLHVVAYAGDADKPATRAGSCTRVAGYLPGSATGYQDCAAVPLDRYELLAGVGATRITTTPRTVVVAYTYRLLNAGTEPLTDVTAQVKLPARARRLRVTRISAGSQLWGPHPTVWQVPRLTAGHVAVLRVQVSLSRRRRGFVAGTEMAATSDQDGYLARLLRPDRDQHGRAGVRVPSR